MAERVRGMQRVPSVYVFTVHGVVRNVYVLYFYARHGRQWRRVEVCGNRPVIGCSRSRDVMTFNKACFLWFAVNTDNLYRRQKSRRAVCHVRSVFFYTKSKSVCVNPFARTSVAMENIQLKADETVEDGGLLDTSDVCSDSWVDLASVQSSSPERVTPLPPPLSEEYVRLLREAQRESNSSSAKVSLASSRVDSMRGSPKSPPNSPNQEKTVSGEEHWNSYYMNSENHTMEPHSEQNLEWIWDWSSRPDQNPPKAWHFNHPYKTSKHLSIRYARVGETSLFSKKGLCALFITNVLSLLLGTGVGLWLSKRGGLYLPTIQVQ